MSEEWRLQKCHYDRMGMFADEIQNPKNKSLDSWFIGRVVTFDDGHKQAIPVLEGKKEVLELVLSNIAEVKRLKKQECLWQRNDGFDGEEHWDTACGNLYEFAEGGPVENKQKFCGYCGGRITLKGGEIKNDKYW